jgi:ubiquinone/menaquinone biosynthesis C-methylase UbiE
MHQNDRLFTDGEAYERLMGRWSRLVAKIFLEWLDPPKSLHWLDVGCGNGAFTEEVVARCAPATVMAVDPSDDQIAYASKRFVAKTAEFRVGDAQALPFGNGSFDIAIMALVISFVSDATKAVAEMARVVRPGGLVATYMWDVPGGGSPVTPLYAAMEALGTEVPVRPNPGASRLETMRSLWEATKLETIETRVIRIPTTYSGFDDFWDSNAVHLGPQGKAIARMSSREREQLRKQLREQLPTSSDGRIVYESFANAVKGRVPN